MCKPCRPVLVLLLVVGSAMAQEGAIEYRGRVLDEKGAPLARATVVAYKAVEDPLTDVSLLDLGRQVTGDDGAFHFSARTRYRDVVILAAWKQGYAMAWENQKLAGSDVDVPLILTRPHRISGVVVDEAGKPVAGAEVAPIFRLITGNRVRYLPGIPPASWLVARTDAEGRFAFTNLPAETKARLVVSAPGKGTLLAPEGPGMSLRRRLGVGIPSGPGGSQTGGESGFLLDQGDERIVLSPEGRIEGTVIRKDTGAPLVGAILLAARGNPEAQGEVQPLLVASGADGRFAFTGLPAGAYSLRIMAPGKGIPDWVLLPGEIKVEAGKTFGGLRLEAIKGAVLEVIVMEAGTGRIRTGGYLTIRRVEMPAEPTGDDEPMDDAEEPQPRYGPPITGQVDDQGVARFRLVPGDYQDPSGSPAAAASRPVVARGEGPPPRPKPRLVSLSEGQTRRVTLEVKAVDKVAGLVRQPTGEPAPLLRVRVLRLGWELEAFSDAEGRFESPYGPPIEPMARFLAERGLKSTEPPRGGPVPGQETLFLAVVQQTAKGLVAVAKVRQGDEFKPIELTLAPGLALSGQVVGSDGKGVQGVRVDAALAFRPWGFGWEASPQFTDAQGRFRLTGIPHGAQYQLRFSADGYSSIVKSSPPPPRPSPRPTPEEQYAPPPGLEKDTDLPPVVLTRLLQPLAPEPPPEP